MVQSSVNRSTNDLRLTLCATVVVEKTGEPTLRIMN